MEIASITPSLDDRIWLKSVQYPSLNRPVTVVDWSPIGRAARAGVSPVAGRSVAIEVSDLRQAQAFTIDLTTPTAADELVMDAVLAMGGPMFVHVPAGCPVPGGYVSVGDTATSRGTRSARSPRRYTSLPCTVTAMPGPDVVGSTVTWATLVARYGSWEQLIASHPDWLSVVAAIGDPDDLVVL